MSDPDPRRLMSHLAQPALLCRLRAEATYRLGCALQIAPRVATAVSQEMLAQYAPPPALAALPPEPLATAWRVYEVVETGELSSDGAIHLGPPLLAMTPPVLREWRPAAGTKQWRVSNGYPYELLVCELPDAFEPI